MDEWFKSEGERAQIVVERRDDSWFVAENPELKCIFHDDGSLPKDGASYEVSLTVTNYLQMSGDRPDIVDASLDEVHGEKSTEGTHAPVESDKDGSTGSKNTRVPDSGPDNITQNRATRKFPVRDLSDLDGSGDYVTVEATIDTIQYIKKDTGRMPDIKGELTDQSVWSGVPFVVADGVKHPYLEEGETFRFVGVKDHHYKAKNENQVMIENRTQFEEI